MVGGVAALPSLIGTPGQIWLSVAPVDLRRGIDGLSALVQQTLGQQPCAGSAFVFRNAVGNRIKGTSINCNLNRHAVGVCLNFFKFPPNPDILKPAPAATPSLQRYFLLFMPR
jgi:hypothetical protein